MSLSRLLFSFLLFLLRYRGRSDCHHPIVGSVGCCTVTYLVCVFSLYEGKDLDEYDLDDSFIDDSASEDDEEEESEVADEDAIEDVGEEISEEEKPKPKAAKRVTKRKQVFYFVES